MKVLDGKFESLQGRMNLPLSECSDSIIGAGISPGCLAHMGDCQPVTSKAGNLLEGFMYWDTYLQILIRGS